MKKMKIENMAVDLSDEQFFETPQFQRRLSQRHIGKIKGSFKKNEALVDLRLTLIKRKGLKPLLIDGQHRWIAMRQLFSEEFIKNSFVFPVTYVEGLAEKELLQLYHNLNAGKSHSTDDILQGYKETIWIYKKMINDGEFPVRIGIYPAKFTFPLKKVLLSYAYSSHEGDFVGSTPHCARADAIASYAQSLSQRDYNFIKQFFIEFKIAFGEFERTAVAYRSIYFSNIMRFCYRNRNFGTIKTLLERIHSVIDDPHLREMHRRIDSESMYIFYKNLIGKARGRMKGITFN